MRGMNLLQMVGGVAAAGVVAAGATALTGTGLATTAGASQFIGGTVSQSVTGASLSTVAYTFTDATKTKITGVTLTFAAGADGKTVSVTPHGGTYESPADEWYCGTVITTNSATCIVANSGNSHAAAGHYTGLTSLDITVA